MQAFHDFIRETRKQLGYEVAKEFHRIKNKELSMSYESYSNIEAGKYLPPATKLTGLLEALEVEDVQGFIHSYCRTLMPNDIFKNIFEHASSRPVFPRLKADSHATYKERFEALLQFNRIQEKYELSEEQIAYIETDLVAWDIVNLFISSGDEGFTLEEIAQKTSAHIDLTKKRLSELIRIGLLRQLPSGKFLVTQDAFIIPRRSVAEKLTYALIKRELERCYQDDRNQPYARFRLMAIDPEDREKIEIFIDNFILDYRRFKKKEGGKTYYLQVLFSERNDLS